MTRLVTTFALAIAVTMTLPAHAAASATATTAPKAPVLETGVLGDAPYRIDIPPSWNGELVVLARGFEPVGMPRTNPMPANEATPVFLSSGYAVAQSGYSSQGWAVREAVADIERLRQHFVQRHKAARRTYLVGFSMGGGIAIASLEQHHRDYDGALSLCGANVPGTRLADDLFTTLVAFDYFFPDTPGIAGGLADRSTAAMDQGAVMTSLAGALAGKPEIAARLATHLQVPADAVPGVVSLHYLIFQDMARRAGGRPVDNRKTVYAGFGDDNAFNAGVRRYSGDAKAMQYIASAPALTGRAGKPLVIQYNHGDPTIAARFQPVYAELARAAGAPAPLTLPAVGDGHCGFSPGQIGDALQTLDDWAESGRRPGR